MLGVGFKPSAVESMLDTSEIAPDLDPGAAASRASRGGRETRRLRLYFLVPLVVAILITEIVPIVGVYQFTHRSTGVGGIHLRLSAIELYNDTLNQHARALETTLDIFAHDTDLRAALARKDRQALLERAAPMFARMQQTYGISHLYFEDPDRVNILRVHDPNRHGDLINRTTTLMAARSGATAYGVELGPIGTFTLRVVQPWFDQRTRTLLGYVELGIETPEVVERIRKSLAAEGFVLIKKEYLDRAGWEEGMRVFGRQPDWNRFPNYVVSSQSLPEIPLELVDRFERDQLETAANEPVIEAGQGYYRPLFVPIQDVGARPVAIAVFLVNVSHEINTARLALLLGAIAYFAGGVLLFVLFYRLVGWLGGRIEDNQQQLEQLATTDALTGVYNHRMFVRILNNEIARVRRHGGSVALLMLDIDHFKKINDNYGHLVGDRVLQRVAAVLKDSVRRENSICRYGGEEFAIVIPQFGAESAAEVAERLREIVGQNPVGTGTGQEIRVTVSVGIAAFPENGNSPDDVTRAADAALYAAKQGGRNRVVRYEKPVEPGTAH